MANTKQIAEYLAASPFFSGMAENHIEQLETCSELVSFKAGDFLLKEGDAADRFFLIQRGDVAIESHAPGGGALTVSKTGAEGVVGYSWLFPPYRYAFDARAVTDVEAIRLNGKELRERAENEPELGYQLMKRFAEIMLRRMQATRRQLLNLYGRGEAAS